MKMIGRGAAKEEKKILNQWRGGGSFVLPYRERCRLVRDRFRVSCVASPNVQNYPSCFELWTYIYR
jgi:hypothetical protein